jgi:hypothetical protein
MKMQNRRSRDALRPYLAGLKLELLETRIASMDPQLPFSNRHGTARPNREGGAAHTS